MRVIRSAGQNVSPADDGRLYNEAFLDGLFEETTIASLGSNVVSIGALYGIMCGRDFTMQAQNINVELPEDTDTNGYIYVEFDTTTDEVISIGSALAPFTPVYTDINTVGSVCQMIIAEYTASAVAVTSITPVYKLATTRPNNTLVGSVAPFETSPATSSHAVGSYLVWNYQLYKVTAAISVGETLVVGSNISATSTGEELSALNSDLNKQTPYSVPFTSTISAGASYIDVSSSAQFPPYLAVSQTGSGISLGTPTYLGNSKWRFYVLQASTNAPINAPGVVTIRGYVYQ